MHNVTTLLTALRQRLQQLLPLSTLLFFILLTGCQEDSRATKTSAVHASELADSRLDKAAGDLLGTFGQREPANHRASSNEASQRTGKPHDLTWSAPLTREDGSLLAPGQIAGFRIYYRLRHEKEYDVIAIENPTVSHYSLGRLPPGAYEFSITTLDARGLESRRSDPVTVDLI